MAKTKTEFQKRCDYLKKLKVEYWLHNEYRGEVGKGRKSYDLDLFKAVKLPITAHEWMALCRNDGKFYIGGCCSSSAAIQDIVDSECRFGEGFMDCRKLAEIAE